MRIVSLASGSGGNAYVVDSKYETLLIDCGLSYAELARRAYRAGIALANVIGVLFTHEHTDHTRGASMFEKRHPEVPFFANLSTAEAIGSKNFVVFENDQPFEFGPFEITAFSIPHDVSDPVGYLIKAEGKTYFHATDFGAPLESIGSKFFEANVATLESNHDSMLLERSNRPEYLKQRIRGDRGHLSNDDAARFVEIYSSYKLEYLALAHLSRECNEPHLVLNTMRDMLYGIEREDITLEILSQDEPSEGWVC